MKSQVTLLLICMLSSKVSALSLTCQQCLPSASGPCSSTQTTCSDQCVTATSSVYISGTKVTDTNFQTCGAPELCVNGSLNMGTIQVITNAKCCSTNFCNNQILPGLPQQPPNGKVCYTCDEGRCSGTVSCRGDEDNCISASVKQAGLSVSIKGCVSASVCAASASSSTKGMGVTNMQCCKGNLCNSAEILTLSFLLTIVPLLSSYLFY